MPDFSIVDPPVDTRDSAAQSHKWIKGNSLSDGPCYFEDYRRDLCAVYVGGTVLRKFYADYIAERDQYDEQIELVENVAKRSPKLKTMASLVASNCVEWLKAERQYSVKDIATLQFRVELLGCASTKISPDRAETRKWTVRTACVVRAWLYCRQFNG